MDASIVETTKQDALFSYQGSQSFQPLSVRWAEMALVAYSEFRDGNVPAGLSESAGAPGNAGSTAAGSEEGLF